VQTARNLVRPFVELAAGVQLGEHDLGCRHPFGGVDIDGNAPSVVLDGDAAVDVDGDLDLIAKPAQRFVDGVVNDFEDEVVQPALAGVADVHTGPLANRIESLEDLDLAGEVVADADVFVLGFFDIL
jgi:hypothetical protein